MKLCKNKEYCKIIERGNLISFDNIKSDSCSINNDMKYLITLNNLNIVYPLMVEKLKILPHLNISVIYLLKGSYINTISIHYKENTHLSNNIDLAKIYLNLS